jgi:hypothetical protein
MRLFGGPTARRRRWWQRWSVRLGVLLLAGLVGFAAMLYRAEYRLQSELARLDRDDPGWRLDDIEAAREVLPDDRNSARVVVAAADLLPNLWPPTGFFEAFQNLPPNRRPNGSAYGLLRSELDEQEPALAEARKLADLPRGRYRLTYRRPNVKGTIFLVDQQKSRTAAQLLNYSALRRADEGDAGGALRECRAAVNAGRSLGDEPLMVSQLIRIAGVGLGCNAAARVLALGEPPPDELAALQHLLEDEDAYDGLPICIRGERAFLHELVTAIETGQLPLSTVTSAVAPGTVPAPGLVGTLLRPSFKGEHPQILARMTRYLEASRLPPERQVLAEAALDAELRNLSQTAMLTRMLMPAVGNVAESCRRKHAQVRCLILALAAERFRRAHGRWPATAAEVTPELLPAVPVDPFDGQPLRLRRLADGIVVYSVGLDGTDHGGKLDPRFPSQVGVKGTDSGYRLWDVDRRGLESEGE